MTAIRLVALALIVAGTLDLAYGSLRYMNATHYMEFGQAERFFSTSRIAKVPAWAGMAAIAAGGVLLIYSTTRRR